MSRYELIIFDCDGVLIDSEIIACAADADALNQAGYPITADEVALKYAGIRSVDMFRMIEEETGIAFPTDIEKKASQTVLQKYRTELQSIAGAAEVLKNLTIPKCVASGSAPTKLALGLIETGLYDFVYPHAYSVDLVENGKPHPDIFEYAADKFGTSPGKCLVIEDSIAGVTAAKAAGMDCLGFVGGRHCQPGHEDRLLSSGADAVCSDLLEVLKRVE